MIVRVPVADAELAADRMRGAGAWAIEERGSDPVELRTVLARDDDEVVRRLGRIPATWQVDFEDVVETESQRWREHAGPVSVNMRLTIHPAWTPSVDDARPADHLDVVIEPGSAFGLGDHPTTRLSAAAVDRLVRPGARVLDVGCGTGVLSVVAARRGAGTVVAIDLSPAAVEATVDNAIRNAATRAIVASTTPIAEVPGAFDLVVANILAPELVAMAADLRRLTAPDGHLVVSGILADGHDHVVAALRPMSIVATATLAGWAAVELAHA